MTGMKYTYYLGYAWPNERCIAVFDRLLSSGRFEILTGALVMTDESVATYGPMLDQLMDGHQWLKQQLGKTVRVTEADRRVTHVHIDDT